MTPSFVLVASSQSRNSKRAAISVFVLITCRENKERNKRVSFGLSARALEGHLVGLHGFEHAEAPDVDDSDLVSLAGTWVEVHQGHDVLRVL